MLKYFFNFWNIITQFGVFFFHGFFFYKYLLVFFFVVYCSFFFSSFFFLIFFCFDFIFNQELISISLVIGLFWIFFLFLIILHFYMFLYTFSLLLSKDQNFLLEYSLFSQKQFYRYLDLLFIDLTEDFKLFDLRKNSKFYVSFAYSFNFNISQHLFVDKLDFNVERFTLNLHNTFVMMFLNNLYFVFELFSVVLPFSFCCTSFIDFLFCEDLPSFVFNILLYGNKILGLHIFNDNLDTLTLFNSFVFNEFSVGNLLGYFEFSQFNSNYFMETFLLPKNKYSNLYFSDFFYENMGHNFLVNLYNFDFKSTFSYSFTTFLNDKNLELLYSTDVFIFWNHQSSNMFSMFFFDDELNFEIHDNEFVYKEFSLLLPVYIEQFVNDYLYGNTFFSLNFVNFFEEKFLFSVDESFGFNKYTKLLLLQKIFFYSLSVVDENENMLFDGLDKYEQTRSGSDPTYNENHGIDNFYMDVLKKFNSSKTKAHWDSNEFLYTYGTFFFGDEFILNIVDQGSGYALTFESTLFSSFCTFFFRRWAFLLGKIFLGDIFIGVNHLFLPKVDQSFLTLEMDLVRTLKEKNLYFLEQDKDIQSMNLVDYTFSTDLQHNRIKNDIYFYLINERDPKTETHFLFLEDDLLFDFVDMNLVYYAPIFSDRIFNLFFTQTSNIDMRSLDNLGFDLEYYYLSLHSNKNWNWFDLNLINLYFLRLQALTDVKELLSDLELFTGVEVEVELEPDLYTKFHKHNETVIKKEEVDTEVKVDTSSDIDSEEVLDFDSNDFKDVEDKNMILQRDVEDINGIIDPNDLVVLYFSLESAFASNLILNFNALLDSKSICRYSLALVIYCFINSELEGEFADQLRLFELNKDIDDSLVCDNIEFIFFSNSFDVIFGTTITTGLDNVKLYRKLFSLLSLSVSFFSQYYSEGSAVELKSFYDKKVIFSQFNDAFYRYTSSGLDENLSFFKLDSFFLSTTFMNVIDCDFGLANSLLMQGGSQFFFFFLMDYYESPLQIPLDSDDSSYDVFMFEINTNLSRHLALYFSVLQFSLYRLFSGLFLFSDLYSLYVNSADWTPISDRNFLFTDDYTLRQILVQKFEVDVFNLPLEEIMFRSFLVVFYGPHSFMFPVLYFFFSNFFLLIFSFIFLGFLFLVSFFELFINFFQFFFVDFFVLQKLDEFFLNANHNPNFEFRSFFYDLNRFLVFGCCYAIVGWFFLYSYSVLVFIFDLKALDQPFLLLLMIPLQYDMFVKKVLTTENEFRSVYDKEDESSLVTNTKTSISFLNKILSRNWFFFSFFKFNSRSVYTTSNFSAFVNQGFEQNDDNIGQNVGFRPNIFFFDQGITKLNKNYHNFFDKHSTVFSGYSIKDFFWYKPFLSEIDFFYNILTDYGLKSKTFDVVFELLLVVKVLSIQLIKRYPKELCNVSFITNVKFLGFYENHFVSFFSFFLYFVLNFRLFMNKDLLGLPNCSLQKNDSNHFFNLNSNFSTFFNVLKDVKLKNFEHKTLFMKDSFFFNFDNNFCFSVFFLLKTNEFFNNFYQMNLVLRLSFLEKQVISSLEKHDLAEKDLQNFNFVKKSQTGDVKTFSTLLYGNFDILMLYKTKFFLGNSFLKRSLYYLGQEKSSFSITSWESLFWNDFFSKFIFVFDDLTNLKNKNVKAMSNSLNSLMVYENFLAKSTNNSYSTIEPVYLSYGCLLQKNLNFNFDFFFPEIRAFDSYTRFVLSLSFLKEYLIFFSKNFFNFVSFFQFLLVTNFSVFSSNFRYVFNSFDFLFSKNLYPVLENKKSKELKASNNFIFRYYNTFNIESFFKQDLDVVKLSRFNKTLVNVLLEEFSYYMICSVADNINLLQDDESYKYNQNVDTQISFNEFLMKFDYFEINELFLQNYFNELFLSEYVNDGFVYRTPTYFDQVRLIWLGNDSLVKNKRLPEFFLPTKHQISLKQFIEIEFIDLILESTFFFIDEFFEDFSKQFVFSCFNDLIVANLDRNWLVPDLLHEITPAHLSLITRASNVPIKNDFSVLLNTVEDSLDNQGLNPTLDSPYIINLNTVFDFVDLDFFFF